MKKCPATYHRVSPKAAHNPGISEHRVPQMRVPIVGRSVRQRGLSAIHPVCGQADDKAEAVPCARLQCPACGQAIPAYKNPVPTVDIIIILGTGVVLVKRKNPPLAWALPGGFVDYGESLEQAAVREACEETGLAIRLGRQFHTYSEPDRDPRQHTISTVFLATAEGTPVAGDDADEVAIFHEGSLPPLAFDHARILDDYFAAQRAAA